MLEHVTHKLVDQREGKIIENYNIKNYTGVGDWIKTSRSIKSSKRKMFVYDFLAETAYIMNVSYFVDFD